jgi:hypothetical protein
MSSSSGRKIFLHKQNGPAIHISLSIIMDGLIITWKQCPCLIDSFLHKPEGSEFESLKGQEFSLLHSVQTGSRVHPTSYPIGAGGSFPGGKAAVP